MSVICRTESSAAVQRSQLPQTKVLKRQMDRSLYITKYVKFY